MASALQFLHGVETVEVPSATQPIQINRLAVPGIVGTAPDADPDIFPLDTPVLLSSAPQKAAKLGATGTLLNAVRDCYAEGGGAIVVVRVEQVVDPDQQLAKVVGDLTQRSGVYALLGARAKTGVMPKTLIAPGFTARRPLVNAVAAANPVTQALIEVAKKLRGRVYASTPSTSTDAGLAWREDFDSDRLTPIYPQALIWDAASAAYLQRPADAVFAGLTARVHRELGFWYSPSNQVLQSVGGLSTQVDWASGDPDCMANILNGNQIATIINMGAQTGNGYGGFRRWGNRTTASDTNWAFESVRTILDGCYEALEETSLWMVDKPPSKQLLLDATQRANNFFRIGKREGWLVGGRCWLDPEDNTPDLLKAGVYTWRIDPEGVAPMEHIIYKASRNAAYYADEIAGIASMISTQAAA